jgi:cellulose synthase/poly-beta-1,6-N-acetylglucosamine synthase-like glycosyltransferase
MFNYLSAFPDRISDKVGITEYNIVFQLLIAVYGICFIIQLIYWSLIYPKILFYRPVPSSIPEFPVSVIICARNEEANLRRNLPLVLKQDYSDFEVIVVNDASTDGTEDLLYELQRQYSHLRSTFIRENDHVRAGKKLALTVGMKSAKNDWVLLTDADCYPSTDQWIYFMQRNFTSGSVAARCWEKSSFGDSCLCSSAQPRISF